MAGGELFDRIQKKGHFTERGEYSAYVHMYNVYMYFYMYTCIIYAHVQSVCMLIVPVKSCTVTFYEYNNIVVRVSYAYFALLCQVLQR